MFLFYSGFKRDVLTPGVGEMCLKNRFVEPARPCCFAAAEPSFLAGSWCCGGINRFQWCLGVRLPRFEAKTTMLQATQTSFCLFHV